MMSYRRKIEVFDATYAQGSLWDGPRMLATIDVTIGPSPSRRWIRNLTGRYLERLGAEIDRVKAGFAGEPDVEVAHAGEPALQSV